MITLQQFSALTPIERGEYVSAQIANWRVLERALRRYDEASTQTERNSLVAQLPSWYAEFAVIDNRYSK